MSAIKCIRKKWKKISFISNDLLILVYKLYTLERRNRKKWILYYILHWIIDVCLFEAYLLDNNCHLEEKLILFQLIILMNSILNYKFEIHEINYLSWLKMLSYPDYMINMRFLQPRPHHSRCGTIKIPLCSEHRPKFGLPWPIKVMSPCKCIFLRGMLNNILQCSNNHFALNIYCIF